MFIVLFGGRGEQLPVDPHHRHQFVPAAVVADAVVPQLDALPRQACRAQALLYRPGEFIIIIRLFKNYKYFSSKSFIFLFN